MRRLVAFLLAGYAALLILRPSAATPPATAQGATQEEPPAGVPLVLPVTNPATTSVLTPGEQVDLYTAHGDEPPTLTLSGARLLDIQTPDTAIMSTTSHNSTSVYIVVQITVERLGLIESLLAATSIVATVSAVDF